MITDLQRKEMQSQLSLLGFGTYTEFLNSDLWVVFSRYVRRLPKYQKCRHCKSGFHINLHHKSYAALLDPKHIIPLCRKCHQEEHGIVDEIGNNLKKSLVSPVPVRKPRRRKNRSLQTINLETVRNRLMKKHGLMKGGRLFREQYETYPGYLSAVSRFYELKEEIESR